MNALDLESPTNKCLLFTFEWISKFHHKEKSLVDGE